MDLKELKTAVNVYYSLFCHRTRVLEGVRKIAWRNMIQLDKSVRWCVSKHRHPSIDETIECIDKRTMADQGMPADRSDLIWLTGNATFCTIHLYLTLLYAEIDYYKRSCASFPLLADKSFSAFLDENGKWVETLGHSRDVFLHPRPGELDTLRFLGAWIHRSTAVQVQLNQYLDRVRERLRSELERMCDNLPENDQFLCRHKLASLAHLRRQYYRDRDGKKRLKVQIKKIHELMDAGKAPDDPVPPARLKVVNTISACQNNVDPSAPELKAAMGKTVAEDHSGVKQTPVSTNLIMPFVTERSSYGNSRQAMYAARHRHKYFNMLFTSHLLLYETVTRMAMRDLPEQYTPEQLARQMKVLYMKMRDEPMMNGIPHFAGECKDMQEVIEMVSLHAVGQALAYEPLRIYCKLVGEDSSISEQELDKWTQSDKLSRLSKYRNSVFHVASSDRGEYSPSASIVLDNNLRDLEDLYAGLARFFGVYSPLGIFHENKD